MSETDKLQDYLQDFPGEIPERIPEDQRAIVDLTLCRRAPSNQFEKELLDEIRDLTKRGIMVEIPFD